jgi:hypothetical protein
MIIHSRKKDRVSSKKKKQEKVIVESVAKKPRYKVFSIEEKMPEVKNEEVIEDEIIEE